MLLFSLFITLCFADPWSIAVGPSVSLSKLQTLDRSYDGAVGINSHIFYDLEAVKLRMSSYWHWSFAHDSKISFRDTTVTGEGQMRSFSLSPSLFWYWHKSDRKNFYYSSIGPSWSLHSLVYENPTIRGDDFSAYQKITYEGRGLIFSFGLEIHFDKEYWGAHTVYLETTLNYYKAKNLQVIGGTKTEVETLDTVHNPSELDETVIGFHIGLSIL